MDRPPGLWIPRSYSDATFVLGVGLELVPSNAWMNVVKRAGELTEMVVTARQLAVRGRKSFDWERIMIRRGPCNSSSGRPVSSRQREEGTVKGLTASGLRVGAARTIPGDAGEERELVQRCCRKSPGISVVHATTLVQVWCVLTVVRHRPDWQSALRHIHAGGEAVGRQVPEWSPC